MKFVSKVPKPRIESKLSIWKFTIFPYLISRIYIIISFLNLGGDAVKTETSGENAPENSQQEVTASA